MKKRNCNLIFSCCSIHETKAKKKETMKKRDKNKKQKESQKRKTRRKKERQEQKRDRERNRKGGGQKRLREEERETLKINQKMPFLGGKTGSFY